MARIVSSEEHRRYALSLLNRVDDAVVYLAREEGGDVVAFAEATLRGHYVNGCNTSPVGFLEGVYVKPPYRNHGLARVLCEALEDWAADLGCIEFASDVLLQNTLGQKVHEALGFEETERVISLCETVRLASWVRSRHSSDGSLGPLSAISGPRSYPDSLVRTQRPRSGLGLRLRAWTDIVTPLLQEHEPSEFRILHQVREPQKAALGYPR